MFFKLHIHLVLFTTQYFQAHLLFFIMAFKTANNTISKWHSNQRFPETFKPLHGPTELQLMASELAELRLSQGQRSVSHSGPGV